MSGHTKSKNLIQIQVPKGIANNHQTVVLNNLSCQVRQINIIGDKRHLLEDKTPLGLSGGFDLLQFSPNVSFLHKERSYLEDEGGGEPGDSGGVAGGDEGPVPGTRLVLDGRYGGDAGEVE